MSKGHKDIEIAKIKKRIRQLEKSRNVEPDEKNASKFYHNSWDKLKEVGEAVVEVLKDKEWSWIRNWGCKYISMRIDMRSGHCVLVNKDGERISIDQLKYQYKGEENE